MADLFSLGLRGGAPDIYSQAAASQAVPTVEEQAQFSGEGPFSRGLRAGFSGLDANYLAAEASAAEAAGDMPRALRLKQQAYDMLREGAAWTPPISKMGQVHGLGDAADYLAGKTGEGLSSFVAPIALGAGARMLAGPVAGALTAAGTFYTPGKGGQVIRQWEDPQLMATTTPGAREGMTSLKGL